MTVNIQTAKIRCMAECRPAQDKVWQGTSFVRENCLCVVKGHSQKCLFGHLWMMIVDGIPHTFAFCILI